MLLSVMKAISPIDGRYSEQVSELREIFSEYGFLKFRITIEILWLKQLSKIKKFTEIAVFNDDENYFLDEIINNFNEQDAKRIKEIEKTTQHDIKAVEYFLQEKISNYDTLIHISKFVHFACTSEDINNLSYALMIKTTINDIIMNNWENIINQISQLAKKYSNLPMLSRTHGQPATPTTMGKEMANVVYRMKRQLCQLKSIKILGKFNGTVGNYNAHIISYPEINWHELSKTFVSSLNITWNPYTTQIEPHDYMAEIFNCIVRFNNILIDFNRDLWGYIALGYFQQKTNPAEVGSSTMPHKINPINFENAEGNLGIANVLLDHFSHKLLISRWQRDLTDSTVLRNIGISIGYSLIAYKSTLKGITKLSINNKRIMDDLNNNWEVLAEAIQTVMKRYNITESYEQLKIFTRGKKINAMMMQNFINQLTLPEHIKLQLKTITPGNYIGLAHELVELLIK